MDSLDGSPVGDRFIEGEGTSTEAWTSWPAFHALPVWGAHEFVPKGSRAVIVAPHPDDEILGCGALMAQLQALGREVLIVAVTDGTASHPGSRVWTPERLAAQRPLETRAALFTMHAERAQVLRAGLPDGEVGLRRHALRRVLVDALRDSDTVFATWRRDGHPDHEAVGEVCATACAATGATLMEVPVWCWHWAKPADVRVPWRRARRLAMDDTMRLRKERALRAFRSQTEADPTTVNAPILPASALRRILRAGEVFFV